MAVRIPLVTIGGQLQELPAADAVVSGALKTATSVVSFYQSAGPTVGQVLMATSSTQAKWSEVPPTGPRGADGSQWYVGQTGPFLGTGIVSDFFINTTNGDYYQKSATEWVYLGNLTGPMGAAGIQIVITGSITLSNSMANSSIIVDNTATNITVTIPSGLPSGFSVTVVQKGTGDVLLIEGDEFVSLNSIFDMKKIQGKNYGCYIEQVGLSNEYMIVGKMKT